VVYLDNAATTFPKPESVYVAMDTFLRTQCANPGRSGHRMSTESQRVVSRCRRAVAELLGAPDANHVVFTLNATDALNIAIRGLVGPGDHVIATRIEHNSVVRPLEGLRRREGVEITYVDAGSDGLVEAESIARALRPQTRMVAMSHASNVVGAVQPIEEVARLLRDTPTLLLVDAAQTAGVLPISVREMGIDLLAFAGHKGTLGPPGTGGLVLGGKALPAPLREGGTGTVSESVAHPEELPERLEAGTLNVSGLAGLLAGVEYIAERGIGDILAHERAMSEALYRGLSEIPGASLQGPTDFTRRVGPVSLTLGETDPREVAAILDTSFGIATRAGLHCAPLTHESLGTSPVGTLRLSPGPFTTEEDVQAAVDAVRQVAEALA
jgi:cysteine desulfurase / selenocysteine lyase